MLNRKRLKFRQKSGESRVFICDQFEITIKYFLIPFKHISIQNHILFNLKTNCDNLGRDDKDKKMYYNIGRYSWLVFVLNIWNTAWSEICS